MEKFAVIGLGRFGGRLARLLAEAGAEVIAVDNNRNEVESISDEVTLAVCLDSTDPEALRSQGIDKVNTAVVGMGEDFEANVMTTVILKQMGVPHVISRAPTKIRADILSRVGADDIVNPERESAERWRNQLLAPSVITQFELGDGCSLAQVAAPGGFHGKSLSQLALPEKYGVSVVAIRRTPEGVPGRTVPVVALAVAETVIDPGDLLLLVGNDEAIRLFPAGQVAKGG